MSDNTASNMITLKTSEGTELEVSLTVAKQSKTISDLIEDSSTEDPIPLFNVTERILKMVIEYCEKHVEVENESKTVISDGKLRKWDKQFVDRVDMETLLDLMNAANYLNIQGLLYATCKRVADMMKGKRRFDAIIS